MCGIFGLILNPPNANDARSHIDQVSRTLEHRGPDDHGWLIYGPSGIQTGRAAIPEIETRAALLHRRLSILDLSEAGWQPMLSADRRYAIIFNGEIYNYVELREELQRAGRTFRSHSDTEVLVSAYAEWGVQALNRLVGMFAFAILDTVERKLFLARDFFGIKPLYSCAWSGGLAFSSEIKGLLNLPGVKRNINSQRLYDYLRFGLTDYGGETILAGVQQLPAAHYLQIDLDHPKIPEPVRYWKIDLEQRAEISFDAAAARLRELFLNNVRLHLRSDVPVGAALSGGIDSSAIVMAMRHVQPSLDLHAFSYIAPDESINEERWVDVVGKASSARIHKIHANENELIADLDHLIKTQDEPFGSTSIYAQHRVFRLAHENQIKVMLDGQGADEMLAGYRPYFASRLGSLLRQGKVTEAMQFLRNASALPGTSGTRLLRQAGGRLLPGPLQALARKLFGHDSVPPWMNVEWFSNRNVKPFKHRFRTPDMLREELHRNLVDNSLPMLLRYEDRNSMAFSIESRVPFLTAELAQFILSLPEEYLISRKGETKSVFRAAMRGIVPDVILDRKDKIGFATPEQRWLSLLRPWVESVLNSPAAAEIPALNLERVKAEWQAVLSNRRRFDFRVWRWVNLIKWTEQIKANFD